MEVINISRQEPQLNIDINAQRSFINYYAKMGDKPATTVRFFDRTDCYTVHDKDDCILISKMVYKSTAFIHKMRPSAQQSLQYVSLTKLNFEMAVRELLLVRNFRVEVYIRGHVGSDWQLEYRGSPGNLLQFEDILYSNKEVLVGSCIFSLQVNLESNGTQHRVGLVAVEQNDFVFHVFEFIDDDFYTVLEAAIVLLAPKECLVPTMEGEYVAVKRILERNGLMVTVCKRGMPTEKNELLHNLNRLLRFKKGQQEDARTLPESQLSLAMTALRAVIKYLDLMNDASNLGQYTFKQLNLRRFVHLDSAAISALNLLPKPGSNPSAPSYRWQSVLGVLDHCRTPQGHRLITQWVKQPLRSFEILKDRHDIVQCLLEAPTTLKTLHEDFFKRIPDILMLTKKLMRRKASLQDVFRIYQVVLRTPKIVQALMDLDNTTVNSVICDPLKSYLIDLSGLKQMVEQVVDFEAIETGEYLVKATFDADLLDTKERMSSLVMKMERLQVKAATELNVELVRLENVAKIGYHFRITLKDDTILRKNKNYRIVDVVKSGVRFTTDKLAEYSEEFNNLRSQYEEQQQSIVVEIIHVAQGYAAPLTSLNNEIAQLDCLISFAVAAQTAPIPYVRPNMLKDGPAILTLKDVRHPCLELDEQITFIANDVRFKRDDCHMQIITGPNMGGKSTYVRSVGISVLLAHIGAFVPCSEATISMVDSIQGRVGASDNIVKGLSTFLVEMIETSSIVRTATDRSLVIIDELGRGTSTYEGCGVAWSIAEHLATDVKCFTLFATHFHEVTKLGDNVPTVKNYHMEAVADERSFTLLYKVRPGAMETSFGIQIARLANFPDKVIQNAEDTYEELEDEHEDKQTEADKDVLKRMRTAVEELTSASTDLNHDDIAQLVDNFTNEIEDMDSQYFQAVAAKRKC